MRDWKSERVWDGERERVLEWESDFWVFQVFHNIPGSQLLSDVQTFLTGKQLKDWSGYNGSWDGFPIYVYCFLTCVISEITIQLNIPLEKDFDKLKMLATFWLSWNLPTNTIGSSEASSVLARMTRRKMIWSPRRLNVLAISKMFFRSCYVPIIDVAGAMLPCRSCCGRLALMIGGVNCASCLYNTACVCSTEILIFGWTVKQRLKYSVIY